MAEIPGHYKFEQKKRGQFIDAVETLGKTLKEQGPLDTKTAHLVQMAAALTEERRRHLSGQAQYRLVRSERGQ